MENGNSATGDGVFSKRLDDLNRFYIKRIRRIAWTIMSINCNCWSSFKYLTSALKNLFFRHYIALFVFILSVSILVFAIVVLEGDERMITAIYCSAVLACSISGLLCKRGCVAYKLKRSELLEQQQLLQQFCDQNIQETYPAGYGANDRRQSLQSTLENLMEPRRDSKADSKGRKTFKIPSGFQHSASNTPFTYSNKSFAGPSDAFNSFPSVNYCDGGSACPGCVGSLSLSAAGLLEDDASDLHMMPNFGDDSYNCEHPFQARISAEAIKAFGPPLQVFGADSYRVLSHSSDADSSSNESVDVGKKEIVVLAEVHQSDSHIPLNLSNYGSNSAELTSEANGESLVMVGSESLTNLLFMDDDDQSLETACSRNSE